MIELIVLILVILISLPFLFKFPEVTFGLFLVAGFYKADPRIQAFFPDFFDLTIFFGIIVFISIFCQLFRKKRIPKISIKLYIPYFVLISIMFLSLLYTQAPIYGSDKFLRFISITTLATFGPLFLFKDIKKLHKFLYTLIFVASIMILESIFSSIGTTGFRTAFGSNYLMLGRITGIASLLIIFYFLFKKNSFKKRVLFSLLFFLNFFGLFFGGGRGPVIAFLLTVAILFLLSLKIKISINQTKILRTFVLLFLFFFFFTITTPGIFSQFFHRMNIVFTKEMGGHSVATRIEYYDAAITSITENPILGTGIGGFSTYQRGIDSETYPHNIILEIGSELGFFGLFAFLLLAGFSFFHLLNLRKIYKNDNRYFIANVVLVLFIYTFLNAMVTGDINGNRIFFVWLGVSYAITPILKESIQENNISKK